MAGGLLEGKRALITGIASESSIAYGIAKSFHAQGAELALTYQTDRFKDRLLGVGESFGVPASRVLPLDASDPAQIEALAESLKASWGSFDIVIHAMAFAPKEELSGRFVEMTSKQGFLTAHDVSAYTFIALAKALKPLLREGGTLLTLSYLGAVQVVPNYNVMGVAKAALEACVRYMAADLGQDGLRVNAISAGPIRTLAAMGIKNFKSMLDYNASRAPLGRNVTIDDVGDAASLLCSPLARGITGQIVYVDNGFSITAMGQSEASGGA